MDLKLSGSTLVETRWRDCIATLELPVDVAPEWFKLLVGYYGESQRHYHRLSHLEEMMQHLEEVEKHIKDIPCVVLATMFHEYVIITLILFVSLTVVASSILDLNNSNLEPIV